MAQDDKTWKRLVAGSIGLVIGGVVGFLIGIPISLTVVDSIVPKSDSALLLVGGAATALIIVVVEVIVIIFCGLIGAAIFVRRSRAID